MISRPGDFHIRFVVATATLMSSLVAAAVATAGSPLPEVSISDARAVEGDAGSRKLVFDVRAVGPMAGEIVVAYTIDHGTTDAADFTATPGVVALRARPPRFLEPWAAGEIDNPSALALAPDGAIFVTRDIDQMVFRYDANGVVTHSWGGFGSGPGQFNRPGELAVDGAGNVYVVEAQNHRVQKFTPTGEFVVQFGNDVGLGQLEAPGDLDVDAAGTVYVGDMANDRVVKFSPGGDYLGEWSVASFTASQMSGLAVTSAGRVWIVDYTSHVHAFSSDGTHLGSWGPQHTRGRMDHPSGITVDDRGNVYIVDVASERIVVLREDGTFVTEWDVDFPDPRRGMGRVIMNSIDVDPAGRVYLAEGVTESILRYDGLEAAGRIEIELSGDTHFEPDESFTVTLTGATHGTLADAVATGTIVNDDPDLGPNVVANPSFEVSLEGWSAYEGATLARSGNARSGAFAALITAPDSGGTFGINDSPDWGIAPAPNARHRITGWVRGLGDPGRARLRVREYSGNLFLGAHESAEVTVGSEWQLLTLTVRSLDAGSHLDVQVLYDQESPGSSFLLDDVAIELLGADVPPVIDAPAFFAHPWARTLVFPVTARDPDGEVVESLTADVSDAPGARFETSADRSRGFLTWRPGASASDQDPHTIVFTARSGGGEAIARTRIHVTTNLVLDPSFEQGLAGWNGYHGGVLERVMPGRDGGHAMRVTVPPNSKWGGVTDSPDWVPDQLMSHQIVFQFRAWMRTDDSISHDENRFWIREFGSNGLVDQDIWMRTLDTHWRRHYAEYSSRTGNHLDWVLALRPSATTRSFEVDDVVVRVRLAGIVDVPEPAPVASAALRAWPNPARGRANVQLDLARTGHVRLAVYDVAGRTVRRVADGWRTAGRHAFAIDLDRGGERLSAGVYFVRAESPDGVRTARIAVVE